MSLPNYLAKIKSSGIYRFVWDKSEIAGVDAEILRLVVGYSDKGPFNTPVYVKSEAEFKSIFGDISKKLEKRGAYFHRMALQCLAKGPILALNLKKFKNEQVAGAAFDVIGEKIKQIKINVENVYDTTRFWKLSPEDAHKALCEKQLTDKSNYISFVATDSKDASCSIIMRGYHPTGYDVTVANWYTAQGEEIPEYFENYTDMLISDFFAEVYVFRGKFTAALCAAEPLNRYFDIDKDGNPVLKEYVVNAFGEKVDTLPLLAAESASNLVNSYSGCLLPFFKGNNGSYISLDLLFNADNHLHKMMMNLDSDLIYNGTLAPSAIATTGWNNNEKIILGTTVKKTEIEYGIKNTKPVLDESNNIVVFENQLTGPESVAGAEPTCFEPNFVSYTLTPKDVVKNIAGYLYFVVKEGITTEGEASKTYSKLVAVDDGAADNNVLYLDADGKLFANIGDEQAIELNVVDDTHAYNFTIITPTDEKKNSFYGYYCDAKKDEQGNRKVMIYENGKRIDEYTFKEDEYTANRLTAKEWKFDFSTIGLKVGDRVLYADKMYTVAEIYTDHLVAYDSFGKSVEISTDFKLCNSSCGINNHGLYPVYFEGYTLAPELAKPGLDMLSKLNWQKEILSAIVEYSGIRLALTNRTDIDYRYIVDTFEAFVDTEVHKELALICKEKDNALGFLNFPAAKTFRDCPYTSFTDQNNKFQVKYIAEGGNRQKNPGRLFTLVSEDNGASFVSYNTPLTFTDGTVKTNVPSAAMVSNNFMEKYLSRQPYYIVAGPTYGRMIANGLVGPDFNYSRADLDILEPMGVNAMVYVPRLGTYINSNQTAKQNPKTALSSINVRELVIYLQDEIEKLLQDYQWEFNTPGLRELIKAKADVICERVKNNGGIYDFLNVCDKSNNTDDVIDNEMFVLSTSIEPGRGAGKMVQELTLYKTGGMQSIIR